MSTYVSALLKNYIASYSGLQKSCWKGFVISFIESTLIGVYYFLSIYFVDVLHINIATAGVMISFYGLGTIFGGFIGGKLSDHISPSRVTMVSLLIQSILFFILVKIKSIFLISADLFILGIATYSFITANYTWILNQCKNSELNKLKAINILNVASNLGIGLSAIIISVLAAYGFDYIFNVSSILLFALALILLMQEIQSPTETNNTGINKRLSHTLTKTPAANKNKIVLILVYICLFFTGMIVSQISTTYPIFLKEKYPYLGVYAFSILFSLNTILVIIFQNYLVNMFHEVNKLVMIGTGSFLIGVGMLFLNFSYIYPIAFLACIIYSAGEMLFFSLVQLFCYERGEETKKGSSLGKYRMVYASSRFVGPIAGGYIYNALGGNMLWYISSIIGITFLVLCIYYREYA